MEKETQTQEVDTQELEKEVLQDLDPNPEKKEAATEKEAETEKEPAEEPDGSEGSDSAEEEPQKDEEPDGKTKRINELTAQKRRLESEIKKLQSVSAQDPEIEKLEKMSIQDLRALKRELQISWKNETDVEKSRKLLDLQDKIDSVVQSAPERFKNVQLRVFNEAVLATAEEMGEGFSERAQKAIYEKANAIFAKYPSLQSSPDGQAIAWAQAADWYKDSSKSVASKEKLDEVSRETVKLKKKISIDTATARGAQRDTDREKLFRQAKSGDKRAGLDWVKKELDL